MNDKPAEDSSFFLTRARLLSGELAENIRRLHPEAKVLTDDERAASLADMLATRKEETGNGVWVFAYGSLIWNPAIHIVERVAARTPDWRRSYCLSVKMGRGTPENPGLMLGLAPGDGCTGIALRVAEGVMAEELDILWRREMVAAGYIPRWVPIHTPDTGAALGHAIAFTINPAGPSYCGDLDEVEMVRRLATAEGQLGSSREYLFNTHDGLQQVGITDPFLARLVLVPSRPQSPPAWQSHPPDGRDKPRCRECRSSYYRLKR